MLFAWVHFNAAGQLIASGERWGEGDHEFNERCHTPFAQFDDIAGMLKSDDHMTRITAEAIVLNMLRCLDARFKA